MERIKTRLFDMEYLRSLLIKNDHRSGMSNIEDTGKRLYEPVLMGNVIARAILDCLYDDKINMTRSKGGFNLEKANNKFFFSFDNLRELTGLVAALKEINPPYLIFDPRLFKRVISVIKNRELYYSFREERRVKNRLEN